MHHRKRDVNECVVWSPSSVQPICVPQKIKTFDAMYPLVLARVSENIDKRGWFWVCECTECGREKILCTGNLADSTCECQRKYKTYRSKPEKMSGTCLWCLKHFTYLSRQKSNVRQYCCDEHMTLGRSKKLRDNNERNRRMRQIRTFNRNVFCIKNGPGNCDNYTVCLDYRLEGTLGPLHKQDNSCFTNKYWTHTLRNSL